jgi:transcriptional regulator with XRE-family HTH domain
MDLGLLQKDIARRLGASVASVNNWELNEREPTVQFIPGILAFLGYNPRPEPPTFGERIRAKRVREGLTHRALAAQLNLDPSTVLAWERAEVKKPWARMRQLFEEFLRTE